ncbi:MAG: hypothetical protein ACRD1F_11850 [Terriglobales bacterium]
MSGVRRYSVPPGVYSNTVPFNGSGQVLFPTNGLSLVGCQLLIDSLGAAPIEWPAGLYALDLGQPFSQFWVIGTVTDGGDLLVGPCGFDPRMTATPIPMQVQLLPEAGTPVVEGTSSIPFVRVGAQTTGGNPQWLLADTSGALCIANLDGGDVSHPLVSPDQATGMNYTSALAVGGWGAGRSLSTNTPIPAGQSLYIACPYGNPYHWKRCMLKLDLTGSTGNLILQAGYYDDYEGTYWVTIMGGASGAGLAAGHYVYATDGLTAAELTGQVPSVLRPFWVPPAADNEMLRLLNTSATVADSLYSGVVWMDNF